MSKRCTFIALSNQKGGVGKSTMTVLLASYFHYVKGKNVAVIDCDYPQFSIQALRSRDMKNVERSEFSNSCCAGSMNGRGRKPIRPYLRARQSAGNGRPVIGEQ